MAKKAYGGVNNVAQNVIKIHGGVNNVSRKIYKGYVGVKGIARQFWGILKKIFYINYPIDYQVGTTYNVTERADIEKTVRYAIQSYLYMDEYRVNDKTIANFKAHIEDIILTLNETLTDETDCLVSISGRAGSNPVQTVEIQIWLLNNFDTSALAVTKNEIKEGYQRYKITSTGSYSTTKRIYANCTSANFNITVGSSSTQVQQMIGSRVYILGVNYSGFQCNNFGNEIMEINESPYSKQYLFYWDIKNDQSLIDRCAFIKGQHLNGTYSANGLTTQRGYIIFPSWLWNTMGGCTMRYEFKVRDLTLQYVNNSLQHNRFFVCSNAGIIYRNTGYWGLYLGNWFMTENDNVNAPSLRDTYIEISYDNFWEAGFLRYKFPYASETVVPSLNENSNPSDVGIFGSDNNLNNCFSTGTLEYFRVKQIPIDYTKLWFYRGLIKSPENTNLSSNTATYRFSSSNMSDFVQYYNTNKILCYTSDGVSPYLLQEWRTMSGIPKNWIRFGTNSGQTFAQVYIPINHATGLTNKTARFVARSFSSGSFSAYVGFAYVDNNNELQTEKTLISVTTIGCQEYFLKLTHDTADYIYIEAYDLQKTLMIQVIEIVDYPVYGVLPQQTSYISITTNPQVMIYNAGDAIDITGMVVQAYDAGGQSLGIIPIENLTVNQMAVLPYLTARDDSIVSIANTIITENDGQRTPITKTNNGRSACLLGYNSGGTGNNGNWFYTFSLSADKEACKITTPTQNTNAVSYVIDNRTYWFSYSGTSPRWGGSSTYTNPLNLPSTQDVQLINGGSSFTTAQATYVKELLEANKIGGDITVRGTTVDGRTLETFVEITVNTPLTSIPSTATSIKITHNPIKTTYIDGEPIEIRGLVVNAYDSNNNDLGVILNDILTITEYAEKPYITARADAIVDTAGTVLMTTDGTQRTPVTKTNNGRSACMIGFNDASFGAGGWFHIYSFGVNINDARLTMPNYSYNGGGITYNGRTYTMWYGGTNSANGGATTATNPYNLPSKTDENLVNSNGLTVAQQKYILDFLEIQKIGGAIEISGVTEDNRTLTTLLEITVN